MTSKAKLIEENRELTRLLKIEQQKVVDGADTIRALKAEMDGFYDRMVGAEKKLDTTYKDVEQLFERGHAEQRIAALKQVAINLINALG